jgi:hypothetical protein
MGKLPLRIAVLECDTPLDATKARYGGYGPVYKQWLSRGADALQYPNLSSDTGLEFTFHDIQLHDAVYPKFEDIDAILMTGSSKTNLLARIQIGS